MTATPGPAPTVLAVIRMLKDAGFQHSRYTESRSAPTSSGFRVREDMRPGTVTVTWHEGTHDFFERMDAAGATDARDIPAHAPDAAERVAQYTGVLAARYAVTPDGHRLTLAALPAAPARLRGLPTAAHVHRALAEAGRSAWNIKALALPDHTRVAIRNEEQADKVDKALAARGWTTERDETIEHFVIRITAAPRNTLPAKAPAQPAPAAPEEPQTPAPAPTALRHTEQPVPAPEPAEAAETPERPASAPGHSGRRHTVGRRATWRTRDGFWLHGVIEAVERRDDGWHVMLAVDTREVALPERDPYGFNDSYKRKPRPETGIGVLDLMADDKRLTAEK